MPALDDDCEPEILPPAACHDHIAKEESTTAVDEPYALVDLIERRMENLQERHAVAGSPNLVLWVFSGQIDFPCT